MLTVPRVIIMRISSSWDES